MGFGAGGAGSFMNAAGMFTSMLGAQQQASSAATNARIQAENAARQAEAQAESMRFNATVSRQMAQSELDRAAGESGDFARTQGARRAARVARVAAGGLSMFEGSPRMVDESIFSEINFGRSRIGYAGDVASMRQRNQGALLDAQALRADQAAQYARMAGEISANNIQQAGNINMLSAGITGFGKMYGSLSGTYSQPGWGNTNTLSSQTPMWNGQPTYATPFKSYGNFNNGNFNLGGG